MENSSVHSCYLGPDISAEQLIPEHYFMHILQGTMMAYDGGKEYQLIPGDTIIAQKNHLIRYTKNKGEPGFDTILIPLEESFLQYYLSRNPLQLIPFVSEDSMLTVPENRAMKTFIQSLKPFYEGNAIPAPEYATVKREELLKILLKDDPSLASVFFNFNDPAKVDLKAYMNRNFRFNLRLERFAFLTGRSLSTFKREFMQTFHLTPGAWLTRKRLEEAYFQIRHAHRHPSDVYLDVGFENLSHFSFAFKKQFGQSPQELVRNT